MTARNDTYALMQRFAARGIALSFEHANTLRRAELTLQHWGEQECGDSNDYNSWTIERDEVTGIPYRCVYPHDSNKVRRYRVPDRERGALRRIKAICEFYGLHFHHQTDPRGCALYVSNEPLPENDYTRGVSCCI
jgi:hypothetical protein